MPLAAEARFQMRPMLALHGITSMSVVKGSVALSEPMGAGGKLAVGIRSDESGEWADVFCCQVNIPKPCERAPQDVPSDQARQRASQAQGGMFSCVRFDRGADLSETVRRRRGDNNVCGEDISEVGPESHDAAIECIQSAHLIAASVFLLRSGQIRSDRAQVV